MVFVTDAEPGNVLYLEWHDYPRGRHQVVSPGETLSDGTVCEGEAPCFEDQEDDGKQPPKRMMRIVVDAPSETMAPYELPETLRDIEDIRGDVDSSNLEQALPITFGHTPPNPEGLVTFFSAVQNPMALLEAARAADAPVPPPAFGPAPLPAVLADPEGLALWSEVGQTRYWEAVNFTGNDHPLHTHGFFFQPIHTRFVDIQNPDNDHVVEYPLQVKDTLLLPKRPGALGMSYTITRIAVRLSDDHLPPELGLRRWVASDSGQSTQRLHPSGQPCRCCGQGMTAAWQGVGNAAIGYTCDRPVHAGWPHPVLRTRPQHAAPDPQLTECWPTGARTADLSPCHPPSFGFLVFFVSGNRRARAFGQRGSATRPANGSPAVGTDSA